MTKKYFLCAIISVYINIKKKKFLTLQLKKYILKTHQNKENMDTKIKYAQASYRQRRKKKKYGLSGSLI